MKLDLSGTWEVALEESDGKTRYTNEIKLPATTEQAGIGKKENTKTSLYLGRKWPICGKVWYRRKFVIPLELEDKYLRLFLERSKFTTVWVDERLVGDSYETLITQKFELGKLAAGEHEIIIRVDNDMAQYECFPESLYGGHQYTEHTQTNWNGILGDICIEAHSGVYIEKVLTHRQEKELLIHITVGKEIEIETVLFVHIYDAKTKELIYEQKKKLKTKEISFSVPNEMLKEWDEYAQPLYEIIVRAIDSNGEKLCEDYCLSTGKRLVESVKEKLLINGRRVSLRGSLDCAIYPLTGACPFTVDEWEDILTKIKDFGMNHYRFHSWCPPKAAFIAADRLGMYLQVELSCFANGLYQKEEEKYDSALEKYLYEQSQKVIEEFGNHPSFILFAIGNEMIGNIEAYNKLLKHLKVVRTDILYSQGANNFLENPVICKEDQFFVTMRTKPAKNIRASFSHNDLPLGSIQKKEMIGTLTDYEEEAKGANIPLIAHEIGQYQSYPYLEDEKKYTGSLRGDTYAILKEKLKGKGLIEKNKEFYYASGALLVECYKAEIEANLRTANMSGFQLLGLQDFTGQGTAFVGVLDSFLDNKGFIQAKEFRTFCNDVVVMATIPKYCYVTDEALPFSIYIYNYSKVSINEDVKVELKIEDRVITSMCFDEVQSKQQEVRKVLTETLKIPMLEEACEARLVISYGEYTNEYSLWLYPRITVSIPKSDGDNIEFEVTNEDNISVWITNTYNKKAEEALGDNKTVLLCSSKHDKSVEGFFPTDFWCFPMFEEACIKTGNPVAPGTMGLLIDDTHEALQTFPTRKYSGWQWQQIVSHGVGVILDEEEDYHIIVQVIDNFSRNHILGFIYEKKIAGGNLIVCASDLLNNLHIPEMKQLYSSLLNYSFMDKR